MTQPASPGLFAEPLGGETTPVDITGSPERDLFYVKSPVTGDTRGVTREEAVELISRSGWEPVVEPVAEKLLQKQLLRESSSPYAAALYGGMRGLSGGLIEYGLPQGNAPGALQLQAMREEHPNAAMAGEVVGTVAPFLAGPLKLISLPGMAEQGGALATRALAGGAPGVARSIASRAIGMGLEGGVQGTAYNAGESAIEDTPLTAQKLGAGFLYGATPGAILGAPIGAVEGVLGKYALKGGLVRERILKPGITDQDMMQIAQREFGVAAPGIMDELNANMSGESAELHKLAGDAGPVGQQLRRELVEAPELKQKAFERAAANLNEIRDLDEVAINGIAGRMKAEQVRKWIPSGEAAQVDADALLVDAIRADTPEDLGRVAAREEATVAPGARNNATAPAAYGEATRPEIAKDFGDFAAQHPQNDQLLQFLNEERRAASAYERERTAGLGGLGIEGTRAGRVRNIANTQIGAHRVLADAADAGLGEKGNFFRGQQMDRAAFDEMVKSGSIENKNVWSLARTDEHAAAFARKKLGADQVPVLFEVETPNALNADKIPGSNTFEEMLLPRGRKLRVVGVEERDGLNVVKLSDAPPEELAVRLKGNRAQAEAAVAEHNKNFVNEGYEVPEENSWHAEKRAELGQRAAAEQEAEAARVADLNAKASPRGKRIAKMSDALSRWAEFDAPEAGNVLRNELGAGAGRKQLRERLNYALANGGEEAIGAYRKAMSGASEAEQSALNKRLLDAGFSPAVAKPWKSSAMGLVDELGQEVDNLIGNAKGVIGKKAGNGREIRDLLLQARNKVQTGDKAQAFIELDYLKKRLGKYAAAGEYLGSDQNVAALARRQYEDLREMLENPSLWGQKAASAQKDINRIMTQRINRADVFFDKFFVDSGKAHPGNPWIRQKEATADSVGKQLGGIINPGDSREYQAFQQHISESRDVLENLKKHYALDDAERGMLGKWGKAVDDAEEAFRDAVHFSQREAQAAKLFKNQARVIPGWGKWVAGHFLGPAGFLGVAGAEQALNPGGRIYARAVLERTLRQSDSRIASAITKILTGKRLRLEGIGATQLTGKASVSVFGGKDKKKAYAETIKELAQHTDPQAATQQASQAMPFATQTLPNFAPAMGAMTAKASSYLLSHAPVQPRWTPQGIVVDQPSDMELHEFEARMRGALDPISVLDDAAEGDAVPDVQIEAAEFVAPELIDHARLLLLSGMGDSSVKLSYKQSMQLSLVMGVSLDPTMEPSYINAQQSMYAASAQSQPKASRNTGNADGVNRGYRSLHQSKDDQIEAGVPPT